jgi:Domain of unknown function (DUF4878)
MSLPPDPHEDDLADPGAAAPADDPAPPPPPPPPAPANDVPAAGTTPPPPGPGTAPPPPAPAAPAGPGGATPPRPAPAVSGPGDPPGAGAPAGPSPARPRRGVLVAIGAVVALVAVVGGGVLATGGGDDDTGTPASADATDADEAPATPEAAAEALFAAARAGDCEAVIDLMAPEAFGPGATPEEAIAECEADVEGRANLAELEIVDITLVSESGNDAVVAVTGTVDGETSTEEVPLRRVDGTWMVAALG